MIFQLGKVKPISERAVEVETLRRWREVSLKSQQPEATDGAMDSWQISDDPGSYEEEELFTAGHPSRRDAPRSLSAVARENAAWDAPADEYRPQLDEDLQKRFGGNLRSALGPGTVIEGKFSFDSPVRIDGTLIGEVNSTSALIVGEQATVNATIRVGSIIVLGHVSGPIDASELVEIRNGGQLDGNIRTNRFMVQEGARFNGSCNMGNRKPTQS